MTRDQVRRAAIAGLILGFAAPPVLGAVAVAVAGLVAGVAGDSSSFGGSFLLYAAILGFYGSIPAAFFGWIGCWGLALSLVESQASADVVHRRFRQFGVAIALAFCALILSVIIEADAFDPWVLLVLSIALVGGALVGELVCRIATSPAVGQGDAL